VPIGALQVSIAGNYLMSITTFDLDLIEAIPQIGWLAQPDGEPIYFNSCWLEHTGLTSEVDARAAIHPGDWERATRQILENAFSKTIEFRLRDKNGAYCWMRGNVRPQRDSQGRITAWIGTCTNIQDLKQAEEERDRFFQMSLDMLGIVGADGNFVRVNPAFVEGMGFTEEELMSRPFRERVHLEDRERTYAASEHLREGVPLTDLVNRYLTKDGRLRWLEWRSVCALESGMIYASARDVTHRKEIEAQLQFQKALLEAQSEASLDGILILCENGEILSHNQNFITMWGISPQVSSGKNGERILQKISRQSINAPDFAKQAADVRGQLDSQKHEEIVLHDERTFDCYSAPILEDGVYHGRVWYFRDVTERKRSEAQLQAANLKLSELAVTDSLTSLNNRRALDAGLQREFTRALENGRSLSLILLDIDHFKAYNDSFGHPAGDQVLRIFGRLLREEAPHASLIARYGGEEFALVLTNTDAAAAIAVAEQVRRRIESQEWEKRAVTASLGVATTAPHVTATTELLAAADAALYRSKAEGRNRVTHHAQL
jgi:diguanylate cyclase (GGDEF)-like protein/PAS domain S-box-containing protein